jgi:DnaJ-class molecular chaperone
MAEQTKPRRRGPDRTIELAVDRFEALTGVTLALSIETYVRCDVCDGKGLALGECPACGGRCLIRAQRSVELRIRAGCADGERVVIEGAAPVTRRKEEPGDLIAIVRVADESRPSCASNAVLTGPV